MVIKSRRMRWAGHVTRTEKTITAYKILVGKPEGKRSFGRPRRRWENNVRMDSREVGLERVDWLHLAQDREHWQVLLNTVMNFRLP
jgi:hypothetical protein